MKSPVRTHKRSRRRDQEGAVMLVVMLLILTATALAGVSLQAAQYELRAAGFDRSAVQTQYVSEAAMATTLAWVDATSMDSSFLTHVTRWNNTTPPDLGYFGEPLLTAGNKQDATRTTWGQQSRLTTNIVMPPITMPGGNNDPIGTFGPRSNIHPGIEDPKVTDALATDYVVDMYDCLRLPGTGSPGSQVNQVGSGVIRSVQMYCVVTARGRSFMFGTFAGKNKVWTTGDGRDMPTSRYAMAHDSRGTIVTPPLVVGN